MIAKKTLWLIACCLCFTTLAQSQEAQPPIILKRATEKISLDGVLDEASWYRGQPARDFWQNFPIDSIWNTTQTEIYMTYDDEHLYLAAKCYSVGDEYIISSLRRDFRAGGNDNITFVIDPFRDRTNAFVFGMNPMGVRREALIANGGQNGGDFDESWDNKWRGVSKIFEGYWTCELAIPFSTLRYKEGEKEWYFNSYRFDMQSNTQSTWNRIPRNQMIMNLAYMGRMVWEEPLRKTGNSLALIPYTAGAYVHKFIEEEDDHLFRNDGPPEYDFSIGGDAKVAVTSGLNLDLTFNPDFSQVEVDQQVINLDRFEIFFPERRQFFLENADLFGGFGFGRINPFFSRRIGVSRDTATGQNIQNPILFGARLSGKLDNNWRVGFLNMQTARDRTNGLPSFNYSVAAVQRRIFSRSNVGLIMVNKQSFGDTGGLDSLEDVSAYNRVVGLDYNLASSDNVWTGKAFYHQSFGPDATDRDFVHGGRINYTIRPLQVSWQHEWVGEDYNAEVGFVPRKGYFRINPEVRIFFYPKSSPFNQHGPGLEFETLWTPEDGRTDQRVELYWDADLRNTGGMRVTLQHDYTFLFEEFDPTRSDAKPLPVNTDYRYTSLNLFYRSDRRPKFSYRLSPTVGQFFNGYRYGMSGSLTYRYQPYGSIELNFNYNYIDLPDPYASTSLFLIGPRIDLTFTRSLFLTTFLQFNDQIDNLNINARLQWRFAPVSDFFLVYTDNYLTDQFAIRNRSIVAKVTYWLNL